MARAASDRCDGRGARDGVILLGVQDVDGVTTKVVDGKIAAAGVGDNLVCPVGSLLGVENVTGQGDVLDELHAAVGSRGVPDINRAIAIRPAKKTGLVKAELERNNTGRARLLRDGLVRQLAGSRVVVEQAEGVAVLVDSVEMVGVLENHPAGGFARLVDGADGLEHLAVELERKDLAGGTDDQFLVDGSLVLAGNE